MYVLRKERPLGDFTFVKTDVELCIVLTYLLTYLFTYTYA